MGMYKLSNYMKGMLFKKKEAMGVVEIILIIVVLISLVLIFKSQITSLVNTIFKTISSTALSV